MPFSVAKKAVDLLMTSQGKQKILMIYGGEPFAVYATLKAVVAYSTKSAELHHKQLRICVATNGLLIKPSYLNFLGKHNVVLEVSCVGLGKFHDRYRIFANGRGTFAKLSANLDMLFASYDPGNLVALLCVYPQEAKRMFSHFQYLVDRGFKTINVEVIYDVSWSSSDKEHLINGLKKITTFIECQIENGNLIFLSCLSRFLGKTRHHRCLFSDEILEVYPDGKITYCPLVLRRYDSELVVGHTDDGLTSPYVQCVYLKSPQDCYRCQMSYYKWLPSWPGREVFELRNTFLKKAAESLQNLSKHNLHYDNYVRSAYPVFF